MIHCILLWIINNPGWTLLWTLWFGLVVGAALLHKEDSL